MSEGKELKISVDTGNIQAVLKRMTEIEHENKLLTEEKAQREKEFEKQLAEKETERQKAEEELLKQGGKGILPCNLGGQGEGSKQQNSHDYYSYEAMVDDLRAKGETETLNKLLQKGIGVFKTNFEFNSPIVTDSKGNVVDSPIRRVLDSQNKQKRGL